MATTSSMDKRRKIRALEARRDALLAAQSKAKTNLAVVRAELKQARK
jgi:hypothetical protein